MADDAQTSFLGLRPQDPRRHLLALILLAICGALLWTSERGRSLTADEPLHLVRGHALWWTHDARLSYAHPPLANAVTSLPYAGRGDEPWGPGVEPDGQPREPSRRAGKPDPERTRAEAIEAMSGWADAQPLDVSTAYVRHDFPTARAELTGARRMMMLWTLALGLFLYVWTERRWGYDCAMIALCLFCLHPTLLAHGRLVTTDMPLVAMTFVSLAAVIAWIERPSWANVGLFGLASTAMVLSKHSGLAFVVVMSVIVLAAAGLGRGGFAALEASRVRTLARVIGQLALVAVAMILAIDAIYMFDRVGLSVAEILAEPEPQNWISKKHDYQLLDHSAIAKLPDGLRLPFPYTWLVGLATVSEQNAMGHGRYFFGMRSEAGHPLYFPVMIFAKSPIGLLVLLGAGAWLIAARRRAGRRPSVATTVLAVFAGVNLASACMSNINIGVRHALTLMPIMIVFGGRAGQLLVRAVDRSAGIPAWLSAPRRGPAVVLGCVLGCAVGAAWTFPAWLGDFNLLVGGPKGGHRISVVGEDWGQDLGDLAELAHAQGWERVGYYTTFPLRREELEARGLEVSKLSCSKTYAGPEPVVIHLSDWVRRPSCFEWLRDRTPGHVVNHHLLVFVPE